MAQDDKINVIFHGYVSICQYLDRPSSHIFGGSRYRYGIYGEIRGGPTKSCFFGGVSSMKRGMGSFVEPRFYWQGWRGPHVSRCSSSYQFLELEKASGKLDVLGKQHDFLKKTAPLNLFLLGCFTDWNVHSLRFERSVLCIRWPAAWVDP